MKFNFKAPNIGKLLIENKGLLIVIGGAVLLLASGYQLATVPLWKIIVLVVTTYLVDFYASKLIPKLGNYIAGVVNLIIVALLISPFSLPLAYVIVGGVIAYFTVKKGLYDILAVGQILVFIFWGIAKLFF